MTVITPAFAPISPVGAVSPGLNNLDITQAAANISGANGSLTQAVQSAPVADPAVSGAGAASQAGSTGSQFGDMLDQLAAPEAAANDAAVALATGQLNDPAQFTALAAQARLTTQLTAAVRNRAIGAFNDIMHMQV